MASKVSIGALNRRIFRPTNSELITEKMNMFSDNYQKRKLIGTNKFVLLAGLLLVLSSCNWYIPYEDEFSGIGALAQGGVIEATGYSVIQSHSGSEPQQRLMAIKAARLDAFRQLADRKSTRLNSSHQ